MSGSSQDWSSADDAALKHAWDWFAQHASQRMQILSYFFVSLALVVAGYGAAFQAGSYSVATAIAIAGVGICLGFVFLEERTRQLVRASEPALQAIEARLSQTNAAGADLNFVPNVERPMLGVSYSTVIRSMILVAAALMAAGAVYAATAKGHEPAAYHCSGTFRTRALAPGSARRGMPRSQMSTVEGDCFTHS